MHLTVFGASGSIGSLVVDQALAAGHTVTAHTRDTARVVARPAYADRLQVVAGDVTDPADCRRALQDADAVAVTLGAGRHGAVREAGTRAVVAAMSDAGVSRLVVQSTLGIGDSRVHLDWWWRRVMFGLLLRAAYADHERQEEVVRASDLDWTILRPSAFTDDPVPGVRAGFGPDQDGLRLKVARRDVAAAVLAAAADRSHLREAVSLSA